MLVEMVMIMIANGNGGKACVYIADDRRYFHKNREKGRATAERIETAERDESKKGRSSKEPNKSQLQFHFPFIFFFFPGSQKENACS